MEEKKKLTYEELEQMCHNLGEQSKILYQKLQGANMVNIFKRLDYLFNVINNSDTFKEFVGGDFVSKCATEIVNALNTESEEAPSEEKKN